MKKMISPKQARIAIIGAGSSGIAAAKNMMQVGYHNITIFEQSGVIGGNWVYTEAVEHSSVYETTHIITSKRHSAYLDFPMPDHYPDYPSHWLMATYFQEYAKHFGVTPKVKFHTTVKHINRVDGRWQIIFERKGVVEEEVFDALLVCSGHHWNPRFPKYEGIFEGEFLHSHSFKNNKPFAGKRVLVIGAGNSGCDAAVEVCRVAATTAISMRRGYHFIPKFVFGEPADVIANRFQWVPDALLDMVYSLVLRLENGDITRFGLQRPDHGVRQSHPVSNSELLYYIRHGRITPRPDISRFDGKMVHFTDGSKQEFDVIIAATGFKITFPFFDKQLIDFEDKPVRLYRRMLHPEYDHLAFIGLIQASGCFWKLADFQAKLLANYFAGNAVLPDNMNAVIDEEVAQIDRGFTKSKRHLIEVDYFKYSASLLKAIPGNAPSVQPAV
ncbi:MAG: NAD(P)-binding domain-containing protein [Chitinophagales bacterium]